MSEEAIPGSGLSFEDLRLLWTGQREEKDCSHLDWIREVTPSSTEGCADCIALGDPWLHLRICLTCGYVGCCDRAKNKHSRRHFQETDHPIMQSFEPGERWMWCYVDEAVLEPPRDEDD